MGGTAASAWCSTEGVVCAAQGRYFFGACYSERWLLSFVRKGFILLASTAFVLVSRSVTELDRSLGDIVVSAHGAGRMNATFVAYATESVESIAAQRADYSRAGRLTFYLVIGALLVLYCTMLVYLVRPFYFLWWKYFIKYVIGDHIKRYRNLMTSLSSGYRWMCDSAGALARGRTASGRCSPWRFSEGSL